MGDKGIRNIADSPGTPGIFKLSLEPKMAGKGKLVFDIKTKDFTDRIVIPNVTIFPDEEAALKAQPSESESGDISFLKEQAWKIEFAISPQQSSLFLTLSKPAAKLFQHRVTKS